MDKLTLLENLETVARKLRALGLHPFTRLGRAILSALVRNITIKIDGGLSLIGFYLPPRIPHVSSKRCARGLHDRTI